MHANKCMLVAVNASEVSDRAVCGQYGEETHAATILS